ncbi:uncharacterized protein CANTADRAFT_87999 [Suhomyces tanzawaensis NRRL Y-17324]|uniref:F-box domain-containing protein n=1 Tax=Suhomyces tanzawaensis NRRL Y-17324 TaxID=984487 RepID=A0A1E4SRC0_9ASCO|nr:uncharacterized protein CANTADRAFT_87999 [Suhomyces tanzawaensis NRRL Y-17324]ODV82060.1 hypothetical protein CANTADRAFT_87999 [Suhomyces tanzawaensis NRRL Y-17324]
MNLLADLPDGVLQRILQFLPQQALLNLALTNYRFYTPCLQQLYAHITIQCTPILRISCSKEAAKSPRKPDFLDSTQTTIYGLNHSYDQGKVYPISTQLKLVGARLTILNASLEVNPTLLTYIQSIRVVNGSSERDNYEFRSDTVVVQNLHKLLDLLKGTSMDRIYIGDEKLRNMLQVNTRGIRLKSMVIDNSSELKRISLPVEEILYNGTDEISFHASVSVLENLKSLILPVDNEAYWRFMGPVLQKGVVFRKLEKFRLVLNSNEPENASNLLLLERIKWTGIKELEIVVGSPPGYNDASDLLVIDCLNTIPSELLINLKRLSIVQKFEYDTHKKNELYDINIFTFIGQVIQSQLDQEKPALLYLSIIHNLPELGNFIDGFEGNYLRRKKLYSAVLPKILSKSKSAIELALPNFFQSLACYEQPMNTMLWNGCKCSHCKKHLELLDQYLLYHKYYNKKYGAWKDINSSLIMFTIGQALLERMKPSPGLLATHLEYGQAPLSDFLWNYHDSTFNVPFRCYDTQVVDQGEFDEIDKLDGENQEVEDVFFDSTEKIKPCSFNQLYYKNLTVCIAHYINDFILQIINLNRGNAEELVIGEELKDGGDDDIKLKIPRLIINGICYNLDKELNGTNFFENVFDDCI